jgi:hypothetical protein
MCEPRSFTTLGASTACCRGSFTFTFVHWKIGPSVAHFLNNFWLSSLRKHHELIALPEVFLVKHFFVTMYIMNTSLQFSAVFIILIIFSYDIHKICQYTCIESTNHFDTSPNHSTKSKQLSFLVHTAKLTELLPSGQEINHFYYHDNNLCSGITSCDSYSFTKFFPE